MSDWAQSGRKDTYWAELIDPFSLAIRRSVNILPDECSVSYGNYTENLSEATIKLSDDDYRFSGVQCMIRIWHQVDIPDDEEPIQECMGTFFVGDDPEEYLYKHGTRTLSCYGPMYRFTQDCFDSDYIRNAGQTIEGGIRESIDEATGGLAGILLKTKQGVDTARCHTVNTWFQIGENRAESYKTICGWAGWEFGQSDYGEVTISPYVAPKDRPVKYTFEPGKNCIYESGYTISRDGEIYNRVVAWWSRDRTSEHALTTSGGSWATNQSGDTVYGSNDSYGTFDQVVVDLPDTHPNSFAVTSRRMSYSLRLTEPCSHDELFVKGADYLNDHCEDIRYLQISHAGVPGLRAGDVVSYQNNTDDPNDGTNFICEITQMDISSLGPGCMTTSKLKVLARNPIVTDAFKRRGSWNQVSRTQIRQLMGYSWAQIEMGAFL